MKHFVRLWASMYKEDCIHRATPSVQVANKVRRVSQLLVRGMNQSFGTG